MPYAFENSRIDEKIRLGELYQIKKTTDYYLDVSFKYDTLTWNGSLPIKSIYNGVDIPLTIEDVGDWVKKCYVVLDPNHSEAWNERQRNYWRELNSAESQKVFNALNGRSSSTQWLCRAHGPVSEVNSQPASRIRYLKEKYGYFIATKQKHCPNCDKGTHHDLLVRLDRKKSDAKKRSPISKALENKIKGSLALVDVSFDTTSKKSEVIVDHKFPSTRWTQGESINDINMSDDEIRKKFQLLTDRANLQKEKYCYKCLETEIRGDFYGIKWYYQGDERWQGSSKADENGCIGCCWYDLELWKEKFNEYLSERKSNDS